MNMSKHYEQTVDMQGVGAVQAAALGHEQFKAIAACDEAVAVFGLVARECAVHLVVTH
jgi:hypothetical protein